ncbi:Ras association domain-containing protein 3 [Collichthys lucidus]|uniref:Ras association domain-containing protein 3 n=1 Tax=Collichthys lucidus TaxID=240159 RepID=A0A4U5VPT4_COLLU|nr:Ras association domain-containing protein 3 [Collichthys lucidus]
MSSGYSSLEEDSEEYFFTARTSFFRKPSGKVTVNKVRLDAVFCSTGKNMFVSDLYSSYGAALWQHSKHIIFDHKRGRLDVLSAPGRRFSLKYQDVEKVKFNELECKHRDGGQTD